MIRTRRFICVLAALASLMSVVLLSVGSAGATSPCTDTYQGASGGDWALGSNWSTNSAPGITDVACIPAGDTVDVEENGDKAAYIAPTSSTPGSIDVAGGTLTLGSTTQGSSVENLTVDLGTLNGPGSGSGALTVYGTTDITSVNGAGTSTLGSSLALTQQGTGKLTIGGADAEDEFVDGPIDDESTGAVSVDASMYLEGLLTSTVPITMASGTYGGAGSGGFQAPSLSISAAVTINLPTELTDGTTDLGGPLTIGDELTLDSSATLDTGSSTDGVDFANGPSTIDGTVDGTGAFATSGGTATLESTSTFSVPTILVNGGILHDDLSSLSLTNLTVEGAGQMTLEPGDDITDSGPLNVDKGTVSEPSQASTTPLPTITVDGSVDITSVNNQGSSWFGVNLTQNGSGTLTIGDGNSEAQFIAAGALLHANTTDTTAGAVTIYDTTLGNGGGGEVTSVQPITLGTGTFSSGGSLLTLQAPGFVTTGDTSLGSQELMLSGSGKSSVTGTLTIGYGGDLDIPAGDELTTGASSSDGIVLDSGSATIDGTLDGSGTFTETDYSSATIDSGATFSVPGISLEDVSLLTDKDASFTTGSISNTGSSTLKIDGGDTIHDSGAYTQSEGTLEEGPDSGTATFGVGGNFSITSVSNQGSAVISGNLDVNQAGTGSFSITGATDEGERLAGPATDISTSTTGAVTIDDSLSMITGSSITSTNSPIAVGPGSYYTAGGPGETLEAPGFTFSGNTNLGSGEFEQTGGTTDIPSGDDVSSGSFVLAGGMLEDSSTIGEQSTTPVTLTGGLLDGTGTIYGAVTNTSGTISGGDAPGTLTIDGNYTQAGEGQLDIPISSTSDYAMLDVQGSVNLAGTAEAQPTNGYAGSASEGDTFGAISYSGSLTGGFTTVTSTPALHDDEGLSESNDTTDGLVNLVVGAPAPPNNTAAPSITDTARAGSTAQVGDTLTCDPGTWTENPAYTYLWESGGSPIANASGATYVVQPGDIGANLTCVVTATVGTTHAQKASGVETVIGPQNTATPTITGTAQPGNVLTCHPGTWTENPTFSYQWDSDGSPITSATGSTYTVASGDVGDTLTCVVTATVGSSHAQGTSSGVLVSPTPTPNPTPTPSPTPTPQPTTPPSVTGTPLPGDTLTCDPGSWTGTPTLTYQWEGNSSPIVGASGNTYVVTISDEGMTISCVVTASSGSAHTQASATAVTVAIQGTLACPQPTGSISGTSLGAWRLGMTKTQARKVSKFYSVTKFGFDRFCMYGGWGVRTGYASPLLVQKLPRAHARGLVGRVVMILAANTHYAVDGIRSGTALAAIPHSVKLSKPFKIGLNTWYLIKGTSTTGVLKVANGVAQEVGIANKQLTSGSVASQRIFLSTFRQG